MTDVARSPPPPLSPQPPPQPETSPAPNPQPETSHPLSSPAHTKEHPVQLPPHQPDPRAPSRNKRKSDKLSTISPRPVRRSARLNPSDVELGPDPTPVHETDVPTPELRTQSESSGPRVRLWYGPGAPPLRAKTRTRAETAAEESQTESGSAGLSQSRPSDEPNNAQSPLQDPDTGSREENTGGQSRDPADESPDPSAEEDTSDESSAEETEYNDDGSIRCRNRRSLRTCPEAFQACGRELDESAAQEAVAKKKRKRKKGKSDVICGRGIAKPRNPVQPDDRPYLMVVGDAEFTSSPYCSKVITTIRVLTLENLPGPYRSYNIFPSRVRLVILQQFLQRYSWGPKEDIGRCLDVFEKIAAEAYARELNETRTQFTKKYGDEKESWKDFPPKWCKNVEAWKGLCDIWSTKNWDQQSATNRHNRTKGPEKVYHVTGSKSMFRHKQALVKLLNIN